jgi:hypothetical protein
MGTILGLFWDVKMTPTARSLALLRKRGYTAEVVERFNSFTKTRHDLFGCIDIIAVGFGHTLAVQTTSSSNSAARRTKIRAQPAYPLMLASGWQVWVHGWRKKGRFWECKEELLCETTALSDS